MDNESESVSEQQPNTNDSSGTRWVLLVALAVMVSLGVLFVYSRILGPVEQMGVEHAGVGSELTVLSLEPFIDTTRNIDESDLKGNVTLINYWGPWCPPCRIEMPHIARIEKKYRPDDQFQFFSVVCGVGYYRDSDEMRMETASYRKQTELEFPIYLDPNFISRSNLESKIGLAPQRMPYPTTVLIDQHGTIAAVWEGYSPAVPGQITAAIEALLASSADESQ